MEFATQLKKYRTEKNLSQEQLAEKLFVSRQTISNWETEKSYPDVHSLLLISSLFEVSLDQLLKGDIEIMKQEIKEEDIMKSKKESVVYTILFLVMVFSTVPLFVLGKWWGVAIWCVIAIITLWYAKRVENFKKAHNLQTYKEIVAFNEGRTLDEIETQQEIGKAPYQKVFYTIGAAIFGFIACMLMWGLLCLFR